MFQRNNKPQKTASPSKKIQRSPQNQQHWLCMVKAIAVAFAITCIFFIVYGFVLTYTDVSESTLPMISLICTAVSCAVAGFDWAKCHGQRGLIWGLLAGLCYTLLLFAILFLASNSFVMGLSKLMTLIVALAGGMVGGILGVNSKQK